MEEVGIYPSNRSIDWVRKEEYVHELCGLGVEEGRIYDFYLLRSFF